MSQIKTGTDLPEPATATSRIKGEWAVQALASRAEEALDRKSRRQWSSQTLQGLEDRLVGFREALAAFQWPTDPPPWFEARMATGDQRTRQGFGASVLPAGQAQPQTKMASGGFDAQGATTLAPGTYRFSLSQAGRAGNIDVRVGASDTWGDVLRNTARAVNQAGLPVRADVLYQNAAYGLDPALAGSGSILALSVNPERPDQDLQARDVHAQDVSGGLLDALRVRTTDPALGPAALGGHQLTGVQTALPTLFTSTPVDPRAATTLAVGRHDFGLAVGDGPQASTYISTAYDPSQASTLSPGNYSFSVTSNGETRAHSVTVGSGWNMGDVLRAVGAEINAQPTWVKPASPTLAGSSTAYSQAGVGAAVEYWPVPSATEGAADAAGQSLVVRSDPGQDLTLADTSGGLLASLGLSARLTGTPVSFSVHAGDTWPDGFDSAAVSVTGATPYASARTVTTAIPSSVTPGRDLYHQGAFLALEQLNQRIGERVTLTDGATGALGGLGLEQRQRPGADGCMVLDGRALVSENNMFSTDSGRLRLSVHGATEQGVPLAVEQGMGALEKAWSGVTDAWNALAKYVNANAGLLDAGIGKRLEAPLAANARDLRWMGVASSGKSGQLWTNLDRFWGALSADAVRARAALWDGPRALVPAWKAATDSLLGADLGQWLKPETAFDQYRPSLTSEFELERKNRLIKLLG